MAELQKLEKLVKEETKLAARLETVRNEIAIVLSSLRKKVVLERSPRSSSVFYTTIGDKKFTIKRDTRHYAWDVYLHGKNNKKILVMDEYNGSMNDLRLDLYLKYPKP